MNTGGTFQKIQRAMDNDPPDPATQLPRTPVLPQPREYPHKSLLKHVFRISLGTDIPTTNPQHDLRVGVIQRPLRPGIPVQTVTHQILLGMHVVRQQGDKQKELNVA